jgi:hypothetical protein
MSDARAFSGGGVVDEQDERAPESDGSPVDQRRRALSLASLALSSVSFLTLLRLADRSDRSPARALRLFLVLVTECVGGTALGVAALRSREDGEGEGPGGAETAAAAAGTLLGIVTMLLTFNWMRTRRRR